MTDWTAAEMPSMENTRVVVTGANSGIGRAATAAFARNRAEVVMACRSTERGERAAAEITEEEPISRDALRVVECDLADLDSVRQCAAALSEPIDVLCNNAGVMAIPRQETADGFEAQLGINHLGHFALTAHLLSKLAASDDTARIITQSSNAHKAGAIDFADLHAESAYSKWGAYAQSKLANLLFAYELDRRLTTHGIDAVSVACHPGYAGTNLQLRTARESGIPGYGLAMRVANRLFAQSAAAGALPMLYAATASLPGGSYVGPDGWFAARGSPARQRSSDASYDERDARRLWERSVEETGVRFPFDAVAAE